MKKQVSFIYEGVRYFTFNGSGYITSSLHTNAAQQTDLLAKPSLMGEMKKLNDGSTRFAIEFPIVSDPVVTVEDGFFLMEGTVDCDGVAVKVKLDKDGLYYNGIPAAEISADFPNDVAVTEEETAVEETVVEESVVVEEPVAEESVVEEPAQSVEEPSADLSDMLAATEEIPVEPEVKEEAEVHPVIEENVTVVEKPDVKKTKSNKKPAGMTFGQRRDSAPTRVTLGVPDTDTGCIFRGKTLGPIQKRRRSFGAGKRVVRNNAGTNGSPLPPEQSYSVKQQYVQPQSAPVYQQTTAYQPREEFQQPVDYQQPAYQQSAYQQSAPQPQEILVTATAAAKPVTLEKPVVQDGDTSSTKEAEDLMAAWANRNSIGQRGVPVAPPVSAEQAIMDARKSNGVQVKAVPESLVEEDEKAVKVDLSKDREAAKQEARAKFSPEVNAVIGDIPIEMLGLIEEFTSNPVDTVSLSNMGDLFCIDSRWHKQGRWFCIDVIPNSSRYFYNSRKGVSIEIKIADLKEWKSAIE